MKRAQHQAAPRLIEATAPYPVPQSGYGNSHFAAFGLVATTALAPNLGFFSGKFAAFGLVTTTPPHHAPAA
jgi:hypothetical protein